MRNAFSAEDGSVCRDPAQETCGRGRGKIVRIWGHLWHLENISDGLTENEESSMGMQGSVPGPPYMCCLLARCFCGTPNKVSEYVSHSCACSWGSFLLLGCLLHPRYEFFFSALCSFILFCHVWFVSLPGLFVSLPGLLLSEEKQKGTSSEGEGDG